MEEIKRLLPNYNFEHAVDNLIRVNYKNVTTYAIINNILLNINEWKYMHDNWIYLEELITANGYSQYESKFEQYGKVFPSIIIWFTGVTICKNDKNDSIRYNNLDTLFSDLREFFGVESLNKPVNRDI